MSNKIKLIFLLSLIGLFIYYITNNIESFKTISIVDYKYIPILFVHSICILLINGFLLKRLLIPFKIYLKVKEWFGLSCVTSMGNLLTPFKGGAVSRAVYLKKHYDFSFSYFMSTLAGIYVVNLFAHGIAGLLLMIGFKVSYDLFNLPLFILFLALVIGFGTIMLIKPQIKDTKNKYINKVLLVINGFSKISKNRSITITVFFSVLASISIVSSMIYFEFKTIGHNVEFLPTMLISIISSLSFFISFTPGSLGMKEGAMAFSAVLSNISVEHTVAVAILDRIINTITIFVLGFIFAYILIKKKKGN